MTGVANTGMLRAGCATVEITPPAGVELSGWAFGPAVGVLQPIAAQALYLDDGTTRQIMISADVIAFDTPYADDIRAAIATACELPADNVMLAATHTHSAPATVQLRNWGTKDPSYLAELKTLLCDSARQATAAAAPARVGWGQAFVDGLAVNRHDRGPPVSLSMFRLTELCLSLKQCTARFRTLLLLVSILLFRRWPMPHLRRVLR